MGHIEFYLRYTDNGRLKYVFLGSRYGDVEEICPAQFDHLEFVGDNGERRHLCVALRSWDLNLHAAPTIRLICVDAAELFADDGEWAGEGVDG